jgi:predicted short-subunit dehydrogenase-like oxidoreductase (DUF2520 family)
MNVAILGSGNVATHLSKALIKAGYPIKQVWSRKNENAINLALEIGANSISSINELSENIDLIIITVSDNAILEVAQQIPNFLSQKLVLHTSGSTPLSVLDGISSSTGVLYPLQTFSKNSDLDFSCIPICIEANQEYVLENLNQLACKLSNNVSKVNSANRLILHISAVFACNFTNYFYSIAEDLLKSNDLDFELIKPIILETAEKALLNSPAMVQTGPAKRNDQITINKHLSVLEQQPQIREVYQFISQQLVKNFQQSHLGNK